MSQEFKASERGEISGRWQTLIVDVELAADDRDDDASLPSIEFGRFGLLSCLGCGAMGVVFRVRDTKLDREVALKL